MNYPGKTHNEHENTGENINITFQKKNIEPTQKEKRLADFGKQELLIFDSLGILF